jgi:1-phosphatidylinositol-4-phosphate 5-kinase
VDELRTSERMPLISQVSRMLSYVNDQDDFTMVDHQLRKRIIRCLLHGICQRNKEDEDGSAAAAASRRAGHLMYNFEDFDTVYVAVGDPADNPDRVKYRFCEYAPLVFGAVRELCGVDDAHFKAAFDPQQFFANPANLKFSDGRSGSFFGFSPDRRFIIKTVDSAEFDLLLRALPAYCRHLRAHPASLVVRFYGLYSLTVKGFTDLATLRVVAMSNVFHLPSAAKIEEQYDLKGSWVQRHAPEHDSNRAALGMDVDLLRNLDLAEDDRRAFVDQAAHDTEFLSSLDIMDYSLLLGFVPLTAELTDQIELDGVDTSSSRRAVTPVSTAVELDDDTTVMYNLRASSGEAAAAAAAAVEFTVGAGRSHNGRWLLRSRDGSTLYAFGIIDMLQLYNSGKKLERCFKVNVLCKDRDGVSVQDPQRYAKRFLFRMSTLSTGRVRSTDEYQALARKSISSSLVNLESGQ